MKSRTALLMLTALTACGVDNSLQPPLNEPAATYTMEISVQPPNSLRTNDTWTSWTTPVQIVLRTNFEDEAVVDDHEDDGDVHAKLLTGDHGDIVIGSTVINGLRMTVKSGSAKTLWRRGHDGLESHAPDHEETHHIELYLEDALNGHAPHGHANVPEADIHLEFMVNSEEQEIELRPVQSGHGYRYEANGEVPLGAYDMHVHVTPPPVDRDDHTKDRWTEAFEVEFHNYDFTGGTANGFLEQEGLKISLDTSAPKIHGAVGIGQLPRSGNETVSFSVRLEDTALDATGEGEVVANSLVTMMITNEDTGHSVVKTLTPIYGESGFHYSANIGLPRDQTVVDVPTDDHADDGDVH